MKIVIHAGHARKDGPPVVSFFWANGIGELVSHGLPSFALNQGATKCADG